MPNRHEIRSIGDSRRDAERYHRILLALECATDEIRRMERDGHPDIDEVLGRLLPDLAAALNAEQAFVAVLQEDTSRGKKWFELTAVYPRQDLLGHHFEWSGLLQQLVKAGKPIVIDSLGEESRDPIAGLEIFDASSAVLVRTQVGGQVRIVGICNKADPDLGPYLAADRMALDNIVELVAMGTRVGERRRRELQGIQRTSAAISAELDLDELLPMVAKRAAEVFGAPATSLMLWDEAEENLVIMASEGLSVEYVQQQCIPKEIVYTAVASVGKSRSLVTSDLRLDPFGQPDLIESERLCSVLSTLLLASGELIGVLNIYSKDTPREFSSDEAELAGILANQAAIAIQNAQLRRREMEGLLATSDAIKATLDLDVLLPLITSKVSEAFSAPATSLMLWDEAGENLVIMASAGLSDEYVQQQRIPKEIVWAAAASNGGFRPLVTPDLRLEPYGRPSLYEKEHLCTVLSTPLLVSNRLIGVLNIYSKNEPREFTSDDIELATIFANQAATAIDIAQLHHQTRQRGEQLAALDQIALDIAKRLETKELLRAIVERATELVQGTGGGVYVFIEADEAFRSKAMYGLPSELEGVQIEKDKGVIGQVLRTKQPVTVADYQHWSGRLRILEEYKLTAVVGAPIMLGDRFLGAIAVHDTRKGRIFGEAEKELLLRFGKHVAVALDNAQAYADLREVKDYQERLVQTSLDGVIAVDEKGWITVFSDGAEQILGYKREEVLDGKKRVDELYWDPNGAREINSRLHAQERLENFETAVKSKDDGRIPIMLSATLLRDSRGHPLGSVGFFKDLRPLKKAEDELRLLLDVVNTMAGTRCVDEGLTALAERMVTGLTVTFCHIMLLDDTRQKLKVRAVYPIPRPQGGGVKWEPGMGKLVSLSTMKHLVEMTGPRAFRTGEIIEGQGVLSLIRKAVKLEGSLQSVLAIPLKVGGKALGICTLGEMRSWERSPFTEDRISLASSMATQAIVAVEKAQAYELALERAKALHRLNEIGDAIASTLELDRVLSLIVQYGAQLLHAEVCSVFLVRREGWLSLEASYGSPHDSFRRGLELEIKSGRGTGLTGHIAKVGDLVNLHGEELLTHPAIRQLEPHDHLPSRYCTSLLAIPLKRKLGEAEEVIGLIKAENKKDRTGKAGLALRFNDEDVLVLKTLANHAMTAIENAQLFGFTNMLQKVAKHVSSTLDLDEVLQRILAELRYAIPFDTASIQLLVGDGLKIAACEGFDERDKKKVLKLTFPLNPKFPNYRVVTEKEPFLISDIRSSPYHHFWEKADTYYSGHIQAWLGVPLLHGAEIIGMISIDSTTPWRYTSMDIDVATGIVSQVVSAIVNAKLYRSAQSLLVTMLDITKESGLETVLKRIVDSAVSKEGIGADMAIIYPYDQDSGEVSRPVHAGGLRYPDEINPPLSQESVVHRLLKFRAPHVASNADGDPVLDRAFVDREEVKSSAGFPLLVDEEPVGVMFVNYLTPHTFIAPEVGLISLFAQQAAIAIKNARRYQTVSDRLEVASNAALFLSTVSAWAHDAANETFGLRADAEALPAYLSDPSPKATEILERIKRKAGRVATLIPDVPTKVDLTQKQPMHVHRVLQRVLQKHQAEITDRHITVDSLLLTLPPILANEWLLGEALDHLVQNAIKAMPQGGKLTVSGYVMGPRACIEVTDTGQGILPETQAQLFKGRARGRDKARLGIGLMLTHFYLNACDGDIELTRSDANGTTFTFHLPLAK